MPGSIVLVSRQRSRPLIDLLEVAVCVPWCNSLNASLSALTSSRGRFVVALILASKSRLHLLAVLPLMILFGHFFTLAP